MKLNTLMKRGAAAAAVACLATPVLATAAMASPPSPPATPTAVTLASGNRALGVSWQETSTGTITFTATAKAAGKATRSCSTKKLSCSITALSNGTIYDVTVVARNSGGASSPSADVTSVVGVPGPPLSVHATAGTALASIMWAPPKASGVTHVTGYVATATPGGFSCSTTGARHCQIAGLASGTKYTVTVSATNAYGAGSPSKSTTVTPN